MRQQIQGFWSEKNPWGMRHRLILALKTLWSEDPALYQEMAVLVSAALADKQCQAHWSTLEQVAAKTVAKELAHRVEAAPELSSLQISPSPPLE